MSGDSTSEENVLPHLLEMAASDDEELRVTAQDVLDAGKSFAELWREFQELMRETAAEGK